MCDQPCVCAICFAVLSNENKRDRASKFASRLASETDEYIYLFI